MFLQRLEICCLIVADHGPALALANFSCHWSLWWDHGPLCWWHRLAWGKDKWCAFAWISRFHTHDGPSWIWYGIGKHDSDIGTIRGITRPSSALPTCLGLLDSCGIVPHNLLVIVVFNWSWTGRTGKHALILRDLHVMGGGYWSWTWLVVTTCTQSRSGNKYVRPEKLQWYDFWKS